MDSEEAAIIIGGGVGPMAGVALHAKIIENTLTDGSDQDHLTVLHLSRSSGVPDRTEWLLDRGRPDPAAGMADVFADAARALPGVRLVGGVPCNTFHAPPVWDRFVADLGTRAVHVELVNMLREAASQLATVVPRGTGKAPVIGVMSTTGTRMVGVYDELLTGAGYRILYIPEKEQPRLHDAIYNRSWGIKASTPVSDTAAGIVNGHADWLATHGADAIILACTELPLVLSSAVHRGVPLLDPVLALARALIHKAAPGKLKPVTV